MLKFLHVFPGVWKDTKWKLSTKFFVIFITVEKGRILFVEVSERSYNHADVAIILDGHTQPSLIQLKMEMRLELNPNANYQQIS